MNNRRINHKVLKHYLKAIILTEIPGRYLPGAVYDII